MNGTTEGELTANRPKKSRRQLWKDRLVVWGVLSTLGVLGFGVWFALFGVMIYDEGHREQIECTVTDAQAGADSAGLRGSVTTSEVMISTSDCGVMYLIHGYDASTRDAVAAELSRGGRFSFEIGQGTQFFRGFYDLIGMAPNVLSYQKID